MAQATFGAGCFWGVEAAFRTVPGVIATTVGYAGGDTPDPSYAQVCGGKTGHTEVVQIEYDSDRVSYAELLDLFWRIHDPTMRQKRQYRSVIFYHTPEQRTEAEVAKERLDRSGVVPRPILTEILPAPPFYRAEEYHQRYFEKHGIQGGACGV